MKLARGFSRQHRIIHFTTIGSASGLSLNEWRICLPLGLHPYPGTTTARAGLPSCVTPSLTYYRRGSAAPPLSIPRRVRNGFTALALMGSMFDASQRVPEYQPVIHRLRLSASP